MKKIYLSLIAAVCLIASSFAQTVVVAGADAVTLAGNPYTTLKGAFDNINLASQAGNVIVITVTGVTVEPASAVLNQSAGPWTSLTIVPVGSSQITGTIAGPLVDLNGADNVTIDGLNVAGNTLAVNNFSTSNAASTIRFINDATNNALNNLNILGSTGSGVSGGVVFFSTGTVTGNDNNTINASVISASGGGTPLNGIYSSGFSAAIDNSNNTISANIINDYFSATTVSSGININSNNSGWTINNNLLYQTATRTATAGNTYNGILITSGAGYNISNNIIGYANQISTGTTNMVGNSIPVAGFPASFTTGGTSQAMRYIAINCAFTAGGAASSIQNNTIGGIAVYTSSGAGTTNGVLCGINVTSGNVNIGTVTGNTIGATSGQGSLYSCTTSAGGATVGIYVTSTNTVSIQNNNIGAIDAVGTTTTLSGGFTGIDVAGAAGLFTISNNTIGNTTADNIRTGYTLSGGNLSNVGTLTSTTGTVSPMVGIRRSATGTTSIISSNLLRGWVNGTTAGGALTGITNTGTASTAVTISNNFLGTAGLGWMRYAFANSGIITGINLTGIAAAAAMTISTNDIQGIIYSISGSGAHTYINWSHAASATDNITNNTFTNLSVNTAGSITFLARASSMAATGVENINNNSIVTGFNKGTAGGTVTFFTANASSVLGSVMNNNLNNFSNVTLTGATAVTCWGNTEGASSTSGPTKNITNNTFNNITTGAAQITGISFDFSGNNTNVSNNTLSNLTSTSGILAMASGTSNYGTLQTISSNTITNLTAGGQINAMQGGTTTVTTLNINNNTISTLSSSGAANPIFGIILSSGGATTNIFKNKLCNIQSNNAGATVFGMLVQTAGTTFNIYNNIIGDLRVPSSNAATPLYGINIGSGVTNVNAYYNTVHLNATSSGALFGSAAFFANSGPALTLRNNIFVNNSVPNGAGRSVAYQRSSTTLTTYAAASNNNLFYAGTPSANTLIFYDGTNSDQTLVAYKARVVARDASAVTENPPFLSTSGCAANFLHINTAVPTQVESGAVNIAGITDDFDADIRQGNGGYIGVSTVGPDIGADEGDFTLMDISAPVISSITVVGNACDLTSRNITATITDVTGVDNVSFLPRIYFRKNGLSYFSAAGTLSSGNINNGSWTFTINYATVGGVVAADLIEYFIVAQDIVTPTFNVGGNPSTGLVLTDVNTVTTAPTTPLSYSIQFTMSGTYLVGVGQIAPNFVTLTAAVAAYNSRCLAGPVVFELQDALYSASETFPIGINANLDASAVNTLTIRPAAGINSTISGANAIAIINLNDADYIIIDGSNNGTASKNLTIANTNTSGATVRLINGATNNVVKNSTITGVNTGTTSGVLFFSTAGATTGNNSNTIQNNTITKGATLPVNTVFNQGSGALPNTNNTITLNNIADFSGQGINDNGNSSGFMYSYNQIYGTATQTSTTALYGIFLGVNTIMSPSIIGNKIFDLKTTNTNTTTTGYLHGIDIYDIGNTTCTIANNMISLYGNGTTAPGIRIAGIADESTVGTSNIYFNTISIYNAATSSNASFCFLKNFTSTTVLKNNIFSNTRLSSGSGKQYAITYATGSGPLTADYNDFYSNGNVRNVLGSYNNVDQTTLAAWRTASGGDANSLNLQPNFTALTDLHLVSTTNCGLDGYGTPIAGITTDFDIQLRDVTTPDMGADEFTATYSGTLAGIVATAVCENKTVSASGTTYATSVCDLIARVVPSGGGTAVGGKINACVTRDAAQQYFNGEPYVQRHYDIEPVTNAATATADITLYFTDQDFINYNTINSGAWPLLPTNGAGNTVANKNNVRVTQFHGTPTGGLPTTTPGNYAGARVLINPTAANVVWNGTYWAVTIPVTGFSGFYLHTTQFNVPLPIIVNYLTGHKQGSNHLLNWKVTCATSPRATMTLERSADSRTFSDLYSITADAARCNQPFDYTDGSPLKGMNYYRLRIVDADGKVTYSTTVALLNAIKGFDIISIAPNPVVADNFKLNVASAQAGKMEIVIFDMQGRLVNRQMLSLIAGYNSMPVNVVNLSPGTYTIKGSMSDDQSRVIRFVKQ